MSGTINPREVVLGMLMDIEKDKSYSHIVMQDTLKKYQYMDKQTRSFITRLLEGTVEYQILLDYVINRFSKVKVKKQKPVIRNILRMAVYQIKFMDSVPDSAACNEAVLLAKKKGFKNLSGFVNGVLRTIIREGDQVTYPDENKEPIRHLSVCYSMPEWIIQSWLLTYDYQTVKKMLQAMLDNTGTSIRFNLSKASKEEIINSLEEEGITVLPSPYLLEGAVLTGYNYISRIKAHKEGWIQVQDISSMLVGAVADPKEGNTVLDICAAPGGKTFHIADRLNGTGLVTARDLTEYKTDMLEENLERQGFENVKIEQQDALEKVEASVKSADIVLADLPCSGLGIMGKKNDIKYNMSMEQQKELAALQREILKVVQEYVKPGGLMIYSTCTINKEENQDNAAWLTQHYPFVLESLDDTLPECLRSETTKEGYLQMLPGIHESDGFFLAKLRRIEE